MKLQLKNIEVIEIIISWTSLFTHSLHIFSHPSFVLEKISKNIMLTVESTTMWYDISHTINPRDMRWNKEG
jgi:hypothetical protein